MRFIVDNMTCMHCEKKIRNALNELGIKKIKVDLENKIVTVALKKQTKAEVSKAINRIGYNFKEI